MFYLWGFACTNRELRSCGLELLQLRGTGGENEFRATMLQDVGDALGRFVEIDGNGDASHARDCEIGSVPLRAVGGKKADAVSRLHPQFDKR